MPRTFVESHVDQIFARGEAAISERLASPSEQLLQHPPMISVAEEYDERGGGSFSQRDRVLVQLL